MIEALADRFVNSSKPPPDDLFREIGFDTEFHVGHETRETIFFIQPGMDGMKTRLDKVSDEAVQEFVEYWQNQIDVAKDYIRNNHNPITTEWSKETQ